MGNLAVVVCPERPVPPREKWMWKRMALKIHKVFRKESWEWNIQYITAGEERLLTVITLPLAEWELALLHTADQKRLERLLQEKLQWEGISQCYCPPVFNELCPFACWQANPYTGKRIFHALLPEIIQHMYEKQGINASALDIAILMGESIEDGKAALHLLKGFARYLTVVAPQKEIWEQETDKIFEECGLAIRVTEELKNTLKNADLVISYRDMKDAVQNIRMHPWAVWMNYSNFDGDFLEYPCVVIQGVDICFPYDMGVGIKKEVMKYYSHTQLAEMILLNRIAGLPESGDNRKIFQAILTEFRQLHFTLHHYRGRKNAISRETIKALLKRHAAQS